MTDSAHTAVYFGNIPLGSTKPALAAFRQAAARLIAQGVTRFIDADLSGFSLLCGVELYLLKKKHLAIQDDIIVVYDELRDGKHMPTSARVAIDEASYAVYGIGELTEEYRAMLDYARARGLTLIDLNAARHTEG